MCVDVQNKPRLPHLVHLLHQWEMYTPVKNWKRVQYMSSSEADRVRDLVGIARYRNGRLGVNWLSRRQMPRWRLVSLNGTSYSRDGLRRRLEMLEKLDRDLIVPVTRRLMTARELAAIRDPNPWSLFPPRRTTKSNVM